MFAIKPPSTSPKKDLDTLFLIAGYTGAGKSTIVKISHDFDIKLFGEKYHQKFRETSITPPHDENDIYDEAIKRGANFQGKHIHRLAKEKFPPKNTLIQLDLKHLVHRLGHSAGTKAAQKEISKHTKIPTPLGKKSDPMICDLMTSSYLKNPFFKRFNNIIVNTVFTTFEDNYRQYTSRKVKQGSTIDYEKAEKRRGEEHAHAAMYEAWERNLYILRPKKYFFTLVNAHGELISNNKCVCANWIQKAKL